MLIMCSFVSACVYVTYICSHFLCVIQVAIYSIHCPALQSLNCMELAKLTFILPSSLSCHGGPIVLAKLIIANLSVCDKQHCISEHSTGPFPYGW